VAHSDDKAYRSFPISLLLSDTGIDILAKAKRTAFTDESVVVTLLEESAEWHDDFAAEVFYVIQSYDLELEAAKREDQRVKRLARTAARLKAKRMAGRPNGEDSDDNVPESEDEDEVQETQNDDRNQEEISTCPSDEEDEEELLEGAGLSYADEDTDEEPASRHRSFTVTPDISPSSSPSSSRGVSPFVPQTSTHHKPMHVRPTEMFKENLAVAPASHRTAKRKYLNE
jgi:hypothetical protein